MQDCQMARGSDTVIKFLNKEKTIQIKEHANLLSNSILSIYEVTMTQSTNLEGSLFFISTTLYR